MVFFQICIGSCGIWELSSLREHPQLAGRYLQIVNCSCWTCLVPTSHIVLNPDIQMKSRHKMGIIQTEATDLTHFVRMFLATKITPFGANFQGLQSVPLMILAKNASNLWEGDKKLQILYTRVCCLIRSKKDKTQLDLRFRVVRPCQTISWD